MQQARLNGVEIAYDRRGAGTPIVMIHGAQGDQTMFSNFAPGFAHDYQVLTFDQRGRALAQAAFTKGYLDRHPEIIPAMIEARRQRPLDPIALEGRLKAALRHDVYDRLG